MTALTGDTEVFSTQDKSDGNHKRAVVLFLAKRQTFASNARQKNVRAGITSVLDELAAEDWLLTLRGIFDPETDNAPTVLNTGFTHDHDIAGIFEAPDIDAALAGTVRLAEAGWSERFRTEWLFGMKEFSPVLGRGSDEARDWGFFALWEWNDQWCAAGSEERRLYDLECDEAFSRDLQLGVNIAGRYRTDGFHSWHHLGAWELNSPDTADEAIRGHEDVADFRFTTSRHVVGRVEPLEYFL